MAVRPRLAIIGCGAVTELCHLPALRAVRWPPAVMVDLDPQRARRLGRSFGAHWAANWESCLGWFDAAVVALPHHLHAAVAAPLLAAGKHVLVEKPMALSAADCQRMIAAALEGERTVLAVGHVRRFWHAARWVKAALDNELLGRLRTVDAREGSAGGWPAASDFFLRRDRAGGGVTMDMGVHVLDLLRWWLGALTPVSYRDDDHGGVEADALAELTTPAGAPVTVELSRTRELRQSVLIEGERGRLEIDLHGNRLTAEPRELLAREYTGRRGDRLPAQSLTDLFAAQFNDWLLAISGTAPALVGGREAAGTVALIERLYALRQPWRLPWLAAEPLAVEGWR